MCMKIGQKEKQLVNSKFYLTVESASDIWIYGCGLAGQWLLSQLGSSREKVRGFIDTDEKKAGKEICGHKVYTPKYIFGSDDFLGPDALVIISVVDIKDVLDLLSCFNKDINHIPLGIHITDCAKTEITGAASEKFLLYALSAVEECHKGFLDPERLFLRSVDLMITERCSLKCRDCSNLMQYYSNPQNLSLEQITEDFDQLVNIVDHIFEIRLIGGEPFMNKEIYKVLEHIIPHPKVSRIAIYTNAMVPIRAEHVGLLRNEKIVFSITNYGALARNSPKIIAEIDALGIAYRESPPINWTDSGTILQERVEPSEAQKLFEKCCGKNLLTVSDNRLYRCPFAANSERLMTFSPEDSSGIGLTRDKAEIKKYVSESKFITACTYCRGRSFDAPEIIPAIQVATPIEYVNS